MLVLRWIERRIGGGVSLLDGVVGGASVAGAAVTGRWGGGKRWNVGVAVAVTAMAGIALAATLVISARRGRLKSPWSQRKRKHALSLHQWIHLFSPDGKLLDEVKFLKKVRSGGIDPRIRRDVWPFLLGVYDLSSTQVERDAVRRQKRKEYKKLRLKCQQLLMNDAGIYKELKSTGTNNRGSISEGPEYSSSEEVLSARQSLLTDSENAGSAEIDQVPETYMQVPSPNNAKSDTHTPRSISIEDGIPDDGSLKDQDHGMSHSNSSTFEDEVTSGITHLDISAANSESSDSESSVVETGSVQISSTERRDGNIQCDKVDSLKGDLSESRKSHPTAEDYATWQRIIRLDALRANGEWIPYSRSQASVSEDRARQYADIVGLKDYDHLEPCRIHHAARLVAILEAYAIYDPEIGYCQGMSDLLSPIIAVIEHDSEAFWCFAGFMNKARHNFRLDEVGIRRQLNIVSKIIKCKDTRLYKHLEKVQAEDCFFVYRMVVVLFRRELSFDQTLCLWEAMWADQAAIRAGIGKSAWERVRQGAPPSDDLLLYAIAACVLQKRKLIIEKYSSMDEILRECNNLAGQLDVWRLLDDAHDLVVSLQDRI